MKWNHAYIENLANREPEELVRIIERAVGRFAKQYGRNIAYVLELIQNADDEDSTEVRFIFERSRLIVANNGKPFDKEDVADICNIGSSHKIRKTGFMGIGFKAVYGITDEPHIVSNGWNFSLPKTLCPTKKESIPKTDVRFNAKRGSIFILEYKEDVGPGDLVEQAKEVDSLLLLFLRKVRRVAFEDRVNHKSWSIERRKSKKRGVYILRDSREDAKSSHWHVFKKKLRVPKSLLEDLPPGMEDLVNTEISVAFCLDERIEERLPREGTLHCFLPTSLEPGVRYVLNAGFLPTANREGLEDNKWNSWLLSSLGTLVGEAIGKLTRKKDTKNRVFDYILLEEELVGRDFMTPLCEGLLETLEDTAFVPHQNSRKMLKPNNCVIGDVSIQQVISEDDLSWLFESEKYYADISIIERGFQILEGLGCERVTAKHVMRLLRESGDVERRPPSWFLDAYACLCDHRSELDRVVRQEGTSESRQELESFLDELSDVKFLLTQDGRLLEPSLIERGSMICYWGRVGMDEIEKKIGRQNVAFLHRHFQSSKLTRAKTNEETELTKGRVKQFLTETFDVRAAPKPFYVIKDMVLPRFEKKRFGELRDRDIYLLLDYIRNHVKELEKKAKEKDMEVSEYIRGMFGGKRLEGAIKLKAYTFKKGVKAFCYAEPQQIYLSRKYGKDCSMESLFGKTSGPKYLSPYYIKQCETSKERKEWRNFLELLGVWNSPAVEKLEEPVYLSDNVEYERIRRTGSYWYEDNRHRIYDDWISPHLESMFKGAKRLKRKVARKKFSVLYEILDRNWNARYLSAEKAAYRYYRYHNWKFQRHEDTSFLYLLKKHKWIVSDGRVLHRPEEVLENTELNRLLLGPSGDYLCIEAKSRKFLKALGVRSEPDIDQVIDRLEGLSDGREKIGHSVLKRICRECYKFLGDHMSQTNGEDGTISRKWTLYGTNDYRIRQSFSSDPLSYIGRTDRQWWKLPELIWSNQIEIFGGRSLGFLQPFYGDDVDVLSFFSHIGTPQEASIEHCLEALRIIGGVVDDDITDGLKETIRQIYLYSERLLADGATMPGRTRNGENGFPKILCERGTFEYPEVLRYCEHPIIHEHLKDVVDFLWLPFNAQSIKRTLELLRIQNIEKEIEFKLLTGKRVTEWEDEDTLRTILEAVLSHLRAISPESFSAKFMVDPRKRIQTLEIRVMKDMSFRLKYQEHEVENDLKAYFDTTDNVLYVSENLDLTDPETAKALSYVFGPMHGLATSATAWLCKNSIEENVLQQAIADLGIEVEKNMVSAEDDEEILYIPHEGTSGENTKKDGVPDGEEPPTKKPDDSGDGGKKKKGKEKKPRLKDPSDYVAMVVEEEILSEDIPNGVGKFEGMKRVKLKKPRGGTKKKGGVPSIHALPIGKTAEAFVEMYESGIEAGLTRTSQDTETGYDFEREEKKIEVKGSKYSKATIRFQPSEYQAAKVHRKNYWLYVVTNLAEDAGDIVISMIPNPARLDFKLEGRMKAKDWEKGITRRVVFRSGRKKKSGRRSKKRRTSDESKGTKKSKKK